MALDSLAVDILLSIFALTDVSTVLSLSQVNRAFYAVVYTKHLWLTIVRDLAARGLIDAPTDEILREFSTHALIGEIRRAVVGPHTWSENCIDPPTLARKTSLPIGPRDWTDSMQLFCGGRYLILQKSDQLEWWDVSASRRVWSRPIKLGVHLSKYLVQVHGSWGICCLELKTFPGHWFQILKIDVETWQSYEILRAPTRMSARQTSGDFVACKIREGDHVDDVLLVNWRSAEFVQLRGLTEKSIFALCRGHIAFFAEGPGGEIHLFPFSSFSGLWRPCSGFNLHVDSINVATLASQRLMLDITIDSTSDGKCLSMEVVNKSPLMENSYDLFVTIRETRPESTLLPDILNQLAICVLTLILPVSISLPDIISVLAVHFGFFVLRQFTGLIFNKLSRKSQPLIPSQPSNVKDVAYHYRLTFPRDIPSSSPAPVLTFKSVSVPEPSYKAFEFSLAGYDIICTDTRCSILFKPKGGRTSLRRDIPHSSWPNEENPLEAKVTPSNAVLAWYSDRVVICYYL
ncbi:hypothetical protein C8R43DRAFT_943874 [Mycena crocata]|nr:hypothetical protein C8R43DRAFT_943874 [Mycena crocata]